MRQSFVDWKEGSKVGPLIETSKVKMKVMIELILYHMVANYDNLILKLDCLNPMNMTVSLI